MENEIKRLEKKRSVTIVVMRVIMLAIVLSACTVSAGGEPHVKSKSEKAIEQAKTILQGIKSGDAEKIADQFSPIAKEKHPELENDIKKWMGFLDGEIISYGEPVRDFGDATWDEDGYIIDVYKRQAELGEGNKKPEILEKLAQYELTLLDWIEAHKGSRKYVAIAGKCWPAFQTQFGFVPCYVNSRLTGRGIPVSYTHLGGI